MKEITKNGKGEIEPFFYGQTPGFREKFGMRGGKVL
jgi:hypothetical protein